MRSNYYKLAIFTALALQSYCTMSILFLFFYLFNILEIMEISVVKSILKLQWDDASSLYYFFSLFKVSLLTVNAYDSPTPPTFIIYIWHDMALDAAPSLDINSPNSALFTNR